MVGKTRPASEHLARGTVAAFDPYNFRARLAKQSSRLLEVMEQTPDDEIEIKVWYMCLMSMWRMEAVGVTLRKEKVDEPNRGSAVRKYAAEFSKAHDARGRKAPAGPAAVPEPEPDFDIDAIINGTDADDID